MHDIADLESRRVVGVFLASAEFADAAVAQSPPLDLPVPQVLVSHPIQDRTDDELRRLARDAHPAVLAAVTQARG